MLVGGRHNPRNCEGSCSAQGPRSSAWQSGGAGSDSTWDWRHINLAAMSVSGTDLLSLQGNIKRDPAGYSDEFQMQWRHYKACLALFLLKPDQPGGEFSELVNFIAQVSNSYPQHTGGFAAEISELLDKHHAVLEPTLRQTLVKALILLRNRQQLSPTQLLPLLFRLFRVQDKALRQLVFRHITADIKNANRKQRNERLNRAVQNFMYSVIQDEHEGSAKKGLAVLTEMWRRHVWRDARTVNVIAAATQHKSSRIMLAAVKFFLGQDLVSEGDNADDSDSDAEDKAVVSAASREDIYAAFHKGTNSSKKKKQKKLKRVQASVKRQQRKEDGTRHETFAALQLLHDPQGFAEKLFKRLQHGHERFETRMAMLNLISRTVGVHKLLLLNFYPFLQKYIAPNQRDVTVVLAALVQACHEVVPPDTLAPVLRQLVDQFVHDKARPEVMTIGLKTVREICVRCPLVMNPELLQDLTAYKKFREKQVSSAARGLIGLFRELAPSMLEKRDRGRGADVGAHPMQYGATQIATRIEGAEMLEQALLDGRFDSDGQLVSEGEEEEGEEEEGSELSGGEVDLSGSEEEGEEVEDGSGSEAWSSDGEEEEEAGSGDDEEAAAAAAAAVAEATNSGGEEEEEEDGSDGERAAKRRKTAAPAKQQTPGKEPQAGSIAQLKKQLTAAKAAGEAEQAAAAAEQQQQEQDVAAPAGVPLEWGRILSSEDFDKIRQLQHRKMVDTAMQKHGLKSASSRQRARAAAEGEADEMMALKGRLAVVNEERLDPEDLRGRHKWRKDKEERMKSVLEGREGREFGARSTLKKQKTGGLSNREKDKRKRLPYAARSGQVKKRLAKNKTKSAKNQKGKGLTMAEAGTTHLPAVERGQTLHPRLWLVLGIAYICIGLVNLCLAALWRFYLGIALGFGLAKMGTSLCGMTLASRPPPPPARGCFGWAKNSGRRLLMWGAGKVQALFYMFRWVIYLYGTIVLLMVIIHVSSPDYRYSGFPLECPPDKQWGCSRIAESNPHGARHLQPLHLAASMPDVQAWVAAWVGEQGQARLLRDTRPGFLHARILTFFFGFADDLMVSLRCNDKGQVVIEVQSQLRLGMSDMGVNGRRNEKFMLQLSQAVQQGALPAAMQRARRKTAQGLAEALSADPSASGSQWQPSGPSDLDESLGSEQDEQPRRAVPISAQLPAQADGFLAQLASFFASHGRTQLLVPRFNHIPLDVAKLWRLVSELGGYDQVCSGKKWAQVGRHFAPPKTMTNLSYNIRQLYIKAGLLAYERSLHGVEEPLPEAGRGARRNLRAAGGAEELKAPGTKRNAPGTATAAQRRAKRSRQAPVPAAEAPAADVPQGSEATGQAQQDVQAGSEASRHGQSESLTGQAAASTLDQAATALETAPGDEVSVGAAPAAAAGEPAEPESGAASQAGVGGSPPGSASLSGSVPATRETCGSEQQKVSSGSKRSTPLAQAVSRPEPSTQLPLPLPQPLLHTARSPTQQLMAGCEAAGAGTAQLPAALSAPQQPGVAIRKPAQFVRRRRASDQAVPEAYQLLYPKGLQRLATQLRERDRCGYLLGQPLNPPAEPAMNTSELAVERGVEWLVAGLVAGRAVVGWEEEGTVAADGVEEELAVVGRLVVGLEVAGTAVVGWDEEGETVAVGGEQEGMAAVGWLVAGLEVAVREAAPAGPFLQFRVDQLVQLLAQHLLGLVKIGAHGVSVRGADLVGHAVRLWDPLAQAFRVGRVTAHNTTTGTHVVRYEGGQEQEVDLQGRCKGSWQLRHDEVEQVLAAQQLAALASGEGRELPPGGSLGLKTVALPLDDSLGQEWQLEGGRGALNVRVLHALPRAAAHGLDQAAADAAVALPASAGVGASPSNRAVEGGQWARAPMDAVTSAAQMQQAARVVRGMHDELEEKAVQISKLRSDLSAAVVREQAAVAESRKAQEEASTAQASLQAARWALGVVLQAHAKTKQQQLQQALVAPQAPSQASQPSVLPAASTVTAPRVPASLLAPRPLGQPPATPAPGAGPQLRPVQQSGLQLTLLGLYERVLQDHRLFPQPQCPPAPHSEPAASSTRLHQHGSGGGALPPPALRQLPSPASSPRASMPVQQQRAFSSFNIQAPGPFPSTLMAQPLLSGDETRT
ncbi:hypothetical protein ACK3TF_002330 [Chlorella vulgaris]